MTVCTNDASYKIVTTGATSGAGTAYPSGAHEFTSRLLWGSCYLIFSCMCMLCRSLIVLRTFFLTIVLSVLRYTEILITTLVSSIFKLFLFNATSK